MEEGPHLTPRKIAIWISKNAQNHCHWQFCWKKLLFFFEKMKIFGNFLQKKKSSFGQFFDIQMAIFLRVSGRSCLYNLLPTLLSCEVIPSQISHTWVQSVMWWPRCPDVLWVVVSCQADCLEDNGQITELSGLRISQCVSQILGCVHHHDWLNMVHNMTRLAQIRQQVLVHTVFFGTPHVERLDLLYLLT